MAENIFSSFDISGQGMSVQRQRLSAVAKNIANVNTTKAENGMPYRREVVIVRHIPGSPFGSEYDNQITLSKTSPSHSGNATLKPLEGKNDVLMAKSTKDSTEPRLVYDPSHPDADTYGYVHMPNINIVTEMVEMITAQRAFEANASVVEAAKNIARESLEI